MRDTQKEIAAKYQEFFKKLTIPAVVGRSKQQILPEYNEILFHAKILTSDQFREYWKEINQSLSDI